MPEAPQSEYVVIARRYRPRRFDELLGQEHVGRALAGAITSGRVGHAYLFTGARGVGKTSAARILAKALNCEHGPTPEPCNQCDICQSISTGDDVDVLEIDGASNRGIDEIRQLRQNVSVRPSRARLKIYIIDEVHMLTREAFNALLKTLEEPPEHVKFIFCTTEPTKIPITILSRCQRFDFAGISREAIAGRLGQIVEAEGLQADRDALELLARRASGSMRDSQSLLEQLLAFGSQRITVEEVHRLLGTADEERLLRLIDLLVSRDAAAALAELDGTLNAGVDVALLIEQLLSYLRDVMVVAAGGGSDAMMFTAPTEADRIKQAAEQLGLSTVLAAMQIVEQALARMRYSTHGRILAELALVRVCQLEELDELGELIAQVGQPGAVPPPGRPGSPRPALSPGHSAAPAAPPPRGKKNDSGDGAPRMTGAPPTAATGRLPKDPPTPTSAGLTSTGPTNVAPTNTATAVAEPTALTAESAESLWRAALSGLATTTANHARKFDRVSVPAPGRLVVHFAPDYAFAKSICSHPSHIARFEQAMAEVAGQAVRVEFEADEAPTGGVPDAPARTRVSPQQRMIEITKHPMVHRANELFGAMPTRVDAPY